jgi:phage terminase large subunit
MKKVRIQFDEEIFNPVYLPYLMDFSKRFLIWYGGRGSGKSHSAAQRIIYNVLKLKGFNTLVVRKWLNANRNSTFALIYGLILEYDLSRFFKINQQDMTITCLVNQNQILFKGLDDKEKIKGIKALNGNIKHLWIEEANQITQDDFIYLNNSLRGYDGYDIPYSILLTFNPVSQLSWLKSYFFDTTSKSIRSKTEILKTTYHDNKFLDDDYIESLEALKDIDYIKYCVDVLGEWGTFGNIILSNWEVKDLSLNNIWRDYDYLIYGLDFGYNHPSAMILVGIRDGDVYVLDELYERKLTNTELISKAEKFVVDKNIPIIADSAEPDRIKEFRNNGFFQIRAAEKGKNSVKMGIDYLRGHKIYINTRCVNTIKEIQNWQYKVDKEGNVTEEPVPFQDDAIAAIRYATEQFWGSKTGLGFVKLR